MSTPPQSDDLDEEEITLLGLAVYQAQRFEFGLCGIAAHVTHIPAAAKDRRIKKLTPELFLRGDPTEIKITLGQVVEALGEALLLKTPELEDFVERRNLICHNYMRLRSKRSGQYALDDPKEFLRKFIRNTTHWLDLLDGLMGHMMERTAVKWNRTAELRISEKMRSNMNAYISHAGRVVALNTLLRAEPAQYDKTDPY